MVGIAGAARKTGIARNQELMVSQGRESLEIGENPMRCRTRPHKKNV